MLASVQLGLNTFTSDIQSMCFEFISSVSGAVCIERDPTSPYYTQLQPLLPLLFKMIFHREIDSENKTECYGVLFMLACTYKDEFHALMRTLIANEQNPVHMQKISQEYTDFTANLDFVNNRAMKTKFIDKFDKFVTNLNFLAAP